MSKIFHLPTFSVNPQPTDYKQKRIIKLISQVNESNRDTLGEAFIRIMEDKKSYITTENLNLYVKCVLNIIIKMTDAVWQID